MDKVISVLKSSWWAILIALLAFATGMGARTQQVYDHEKRITVLEQNAITRPEYDEMLKRFDRIDQQFDRIENKIDQHMLNHARENPQ